MKSVVCLKAYPGGFKIKSEARFELSAKERAYLMVQILLDDFSIKYYMHIKKSKSSIFSTAVIKNVGLKFKTVKDITWYLKVFALVLYDKIKSSGFTLPPVV